MTPLKFIRHHVFGGISQKAFADLIGRRQATICGWELGRTDIGLNDLRAIREAARKRRLPWKDSFPFMSEKTLSKRGAKFSKPS